MNEEITIKDFQRFYNSEEYHKLKAIEQNYTLFDIIGKSRKELIHSSMIAWILGNKELERLPEHPVLFLLRLFATNAEEQKADTERERTCFIEDDLWNDIMTNSISITEVNIKTEVTIDNKRIDILIECKLNNKDQLRIVVENKVDTHEHDNQCKNYFDHYDNNKGGYKNLFIYLAPDKSELLSDEHFVKISYQELLDSVLSPILEFRSFYSEKTTQYIEEYINTITSIKNHLAMDVKQKDLLKKLFENNKELITAAINAGDDEELKEAIQSAQRNKNYTYEVTIGNNTTKDLNARGVAKEVAKYLIEKEKYSEFYTLDGKGEIGGQTFNLGSVEKDFFIDIDDLSGDSKKKDRVFNDIEGLPENIKVNNQWTRDKILSLKKKLENEKEIKIEEINSEN